MEHILRAGPDGAIYQPDLFRVINPGDTIFIDADTPISYFYGGPIKGTPDNPVYVRNYKKVIPMTAGFDMGSWQSVRVLGDGDSNAKYGFEIVGQAKPGEWRGGAGCSIKGFAKDLEVARLHIKNQGFGIWLKNEPECVPAGTKPEDNINLHTIADVYIHEVFIEDTQVEGIYGGSTNFLKGPSNVRPIDCGNGVQPIPPPRLKNIRINDNIFDYTGRAAVQLSFASEGRSEVKRNRITRSGTEGADTQGNGINIGALTKVDVWDNYIRHCLTSGICSFGQDTDIRNNDIDDIGHISDDQPVLAWAWGIWIDTRETQPFTKSRIYVVGNKIGKRGAGGPQDNGWSDITIADQFGVNGSGWEAGNVVKDNVSTVTGKEAVVFVAKGIDVNGVVKDPVVLPPPPPVADTRKWVEIGHENATFTLQKPGIVRYGAGNYWSKDFPLPAGTYTASNDFFGGDPVVGVIKAVELLDDGTAVPPPVDPSPVPVPPVPVEPTVLFKQWVYMDKTVSTAVKQNTKKELHSQVAYMSDKTVRKLK